MDPTPQERLAQAEEHVAFGEAHISRQREIVAALSKNGHDPTSAIGLLRQFEAIQELHCAQLDRLLRESDAPARDVGHDPAR